MIDKKGTSAYNNRKISALDGRVSSSAIDWIGIVCIYVPFICIMCTDVANWTKTWGSLKAVTYFERTISCGLHNK
jgi:hypothetical protein